MSGFLRLLSAASILGALGILLRELFRQRAELLRPASSDLGRSRSAPERNRARTANDGTGPSRQELYEEAQRLEIKGRSKMKKDQLERAVKKARAAR
jgi:hypothetical protein